MKCVIVSGSNNQVSTTLKKATEIIEFLISKKKIAEVRIFDLSKHELNTCIGCLYCRKHEDCLFDTKDNMVNIKQSLLDSDLVVFCSPTYVNNISATMKNFIDRIHVWTHMMRLIGKKGIILTCSGSPGNTFANKYLVDVLLYMGADVIYSKNFSLYESENIGSIANEICENISLDKIKSIDKLEPLYKSILENIKKAVNYYELNDQKIDLKEVSYWVDTGIINCSTYLEAFKLIECNRRESEE